uniref:Uncharacterized protein n=1 Tax=uncultured bacterium A1Q1_fos_300 TaxID=1256571 RepID=L7VZV0_9BACT|nr:hypothetical protein [uncultured bacterium A1Q1_fos_300]
MAKSSTVTSGTKLKRQPLNKNKWLRGHADKGNRPSVQETQ